MRYDRAEIGLYATVAVSSSLMVVFDELFWAGFCAGLLSNMVCVRLMLLRAKRVAQSEEE